MTLPRPKNYPARCNISLVTYNSRADLPNFFESLEQQTYTDYCVTVIDNASNDGTVEYLKNLQPNVRIIVNSANLGYDAAHNQGVAATDSPYVLVANADIRLAPNFIMDCLTLMAANDKIGSVGGKLIKLMPALKTNENSDMLDSTGLMCFKNGRVIDRGEGEIDRGQYDTQEQVFGISGALVLYRKSALEDIRLTDGQYFDKSYFMYQDDIDVAWRLRLRGWESWYIPKAVAWHRRSAQSQSRGNALAVFMNRRRKSSLINQLSYRNHLATLIKNESRGNLLRWFPLIVWYELRKFIYLVFIEPRTLIRSGQLWAQLPELLRRRKIIHQRSVVAERDLRRWFH